MPEDVAKERVGEVRTAEEGERDEQRGRAPAREVQIRRGASMGRAGLTRVRVLVSPWGPFGPRGCCEVSCTPRGRGKTREALHGEEIYVSFGFGDTRCVCLVKRVGAVRRNG